MATTQQTGQELSPWWKIGVITIIIIGFSVLIFVATLAYKDAPPIPVKVFSATGETLFTRHDIQAGQQVFLKYALMENGTIWGHGAYLGRIFPPPTSTHLALEAGDMEARQGYGRSLAEPRPRPARCGGGRGATPPQRESLQPPNPDFGLLGTGGRGLSAAGGRLDRLFRPSRAKRWPESQVHHRPPGAAPAHRLFCLDRLGRSGQSPRTGLFLYQQFSLSIPWRGTRPRPRPTCGAP